jgi:hypothetical protein
MSEIPKIQWPATYLGRLQAVTAELRMVGSPASVNTLTQRFSGATTVEVEATLAALVLFGRVQKSGDLFSMTESV